MSGGQKARVALARAIYRDADVFLLDDPLSAVDAHVGRFIFNECIKDQLKDKTVLLVTHQVQLLSECDQIIIMEEAKVKAVGTYEELTQSGLDIQSYIPQYNAEREGENESEGTRETDSPVLQEIVPKEDEEEKEMSESKQEDISSKRMMKEASVAAAKVRKEDNRSSNITSKEEQSEGDVPFRVYMKYIRAGGITTFAFMCLFVLIQQAFQVLSYFWLQYWGTRSDSAEQNNNDLSTSRNLWYLRIFALLSFLSLVANMIRALCLADHRIRTSSILHSNLLVNTLGGSIAFFDVTPIGRILNRFSSDMDVVDEQLAQTIAQLTSSFGSVLSAVGGIIGATKGFFMILLVPLVWFYFRVQKFFRKSNTAIARLEAISRSPIYADFSQALSGLSSLRAYGDQERFIDNLERSIDSNSIANVMQQLASSWLSLRLDLIGASVSFFIAALAAGASGFIPAGFVAVGLSYSFQLTSFLKFFLRMVSTFEANMSSIERIQYYVDSVPQEGLPDKELPLSEISKDWPQTGSIRGEKVDLRYRDGPLVLKDLSFDIKPMEKIGVAGRTGSGKSSTMIAIYRMQELAGGAIYIDNVDISTIPLQLLRSKLGIIPQDPVMFSASVRFNLDPFLEHTDTEIWNILDSIHLKDHILSLPHKLEEYVAEGGDNFSAGQRQVNYLVSQCCDLFFIVLLQI